MMDEAIDLDPADRATVVALLKRHVPDCEVRAYGSRVRWTARLYSDLDLAVVGSDALSPLALMELRVALDDSHIPFSVDVLAWESLPDSFQREIERKYVILQKAKKIEGWREVLIGDIADIVGGGTPSTKQSEYFGGDIPWLTPKDLSGAKERYVMRGDRNLTEQGLRHSSATLLPERTVLLTTRAPVGYVALAAQPVSTNQGFRSLIVRDDYCPEFVYYWLSANTAELERHASGSTFKELSGSALKLIRMRVPSKEEQQRIASVLGVLDDRIELNRNMCETLEEMAQALFRAWFVDFDPVVSKMEGRWRRGQSLPGLPAHLYDLFPNKLADSELGPIPAGWKTSTVSELCVQIDNGGTPKRNDDRNWGGRIPWFVTAELQDRPLGLSGECITDLGLEASSCKLWPAGTILIALYASPTVGRLGLLTIDAAANQACCGLQAKPAFGPYYVYGILFHAREWLQSVAVGSAQQNISQRIVRDLRSVVADSDVHRAFNDIVSPIWALLIKLTAQNRLLTEARDKLLPELISGKFRFSSADDDIALGAISASEQSYIAAAELP